MLCKQVFLPVQGDFHYFIFMDNMKRANIMETFDDIKSFDVVQCSMHHEKVAFDKKGSPIHSLQGNSVVFDRIQLCAPEYRCLNIGCAHSSSNIKFERLLEHLETLLPKDADQIMLFKNQFQSTITKIYALDHKVGHLEHELALCLLKPNHDRNRHLKASMAILKSEHKGLICELSRIKSDIEQFIDNVII